MKTIKESYISPETTVIDLKTEGVICASGEFTVPEFPDGGTLHFN